MSRRPIFEDTLDGLRAMAPNSDVAAYFLDRRTARPLRLSRRGEYAASELVDQMGRGEARRWVVRLLAELEGGDACGR